MKPLAVGLISVSVSVFVVTSCGSSRNVDDPSTAQTDPVRVTAVAPDASESETSVSTAIAEVASTTAVPVDTQVEVVDPVIRQVAPDGSGGLDSMQAIVSGVVDIDGDCIFLTEPEAERVVIVWPFEATWDATSRTILLADGLAIADGDSITGGGGYVPDVGGLAGRCARRGGEIALFNNVSGQIQRVP